MHSDANSMQPELGAGGSQTPVDTRGESGFVAEGGGRMEEMIVAALCTPIVPHIPAAVHPNVISIVNHFVGWLTAALAVLSVDATQPMRSLLLGAAGVTMLTSMIGDCLDGMHARATGQCSKLGEMMDHWLDAAVVPLVPVGICIALEMPTWGVAAVVITASMVYHGQLVLYHHSGKFVHPDSTTGVEAQLGLSLGYVGLAGFFYFVDPATGWVRHFVTALAVVGTIVQLRINGFYFKRLDAHLRPILTYAALCSGFAALMLTGAFGVHAFSMLVICTSFRLCGSYVLFTIVKQPFGGNDRGLWVGLIGMALLHGARPPGLDPDLLTTGMPALCCAYAVLRNALDFLQHYRALAPKEAV